MERRLGYGNAEEQGLLVDRFKNGTALSFSFTGVKVENQDAVGITALEQVIEGVTQEVLLITVADGVSGNPDQNSRIPWNPGQTSRDFVEEVVRAARDYAQLEDRPIKPGVLHRKAQNKLFESFNRDQTHRGGLVAATAVIYPDYAWVHQVGDIEVTHAAETMDFGPDPDLLPQNGALVAYMTWLRSGNAEHTKENLRRWKTRILTPSDPGEVQPRHAIFNTVERGTWEGRSVRLSFHPGEHLLLSTDGALVYEDSEALQSLWPQISRDPVQMMTSIRANASNWSTDNASGVWYTRRA